MASFTISLSCMTSAHIPWPSLSRSPLQLAAQAVLLQEGLVVRLQGLDVRELIALRVEVELVELLDPLQLLGILRSFELRVGPAIVPWVEGVETDHGQPLLRDGAAVVLQHLVHVFVVAERDHEIVKTTASLVHTQLRAVDWMMQVGVLREALLAEDTGFSRFAANNEGVAYDGPLLEDVLSGHLGEGQDLANIVQKPHEVEPVLVRPDLPDALGRLEVVDAVRKLVVGIRVVDQVVQEGDHFHDGEFALVELQPLLTHLLSKLHSLSSVHDFVGHLDNLLAFGILIIPEVVAEGVLSGLPVVEALQTQLRTLVLLHHRGRCTVGGGHPFCF
mmetsp:Transcript_76944/g.168192  ORF Transcript_76944/g.168192 Transcript_76944/m.168192 type:complete len:332 (-) Transcript_76944:105-1100(-)